MKITVTRTQLPGVLIVDTPYNRDERGFFLEAWHARDYADAGLDLRFVQDNHSRSQRGVVVLSSSSRPARNRSVSASSRLPNKSMSLFQSSS